MLAGAAAGLHDVTGFPGKETFQYRPDRLMVAVICRRVETAVWFDPPAVLAEFLDIFNHGILPDLLTASFRYDCAHHFKPR